MAGCCSDLVELYGVEERPALDVARAGRRVSNKGFAISNFSLVQINGDVAAIIGLESTMHRKCLKNAVLPFVISTIPYL